MILTLGDSFTVKRYDGDKPWPKWLAQWLKKRLLNLSHEGVSNQWMFRNMVWALEEYPEIELVVVALSNWDRWELPYADYANNKLNFGCGLGEKTKSIKPKQVVSEPSNVFNKTYGDHYNTLYFVDQTAAFMLTMTNLCKAKDIPIIFTQPIVPFNNFRAKEVATGVYDFKTDYTDQEEMYVDDFSLLTEINPKQLACMDLSSNSVLYWGLPDGGENHKRFLRDNEDFKKNNLFQYFIDADPSHQMGYHSEWIYKGGDKYRKEWDAHPNQKGHKMIAKTILDHYNNMGKMKDYYRKD